MRTLAAALLVLAAQPASPCSAFLRDGPDGPVMAKGYDWNDERGLVLVNKRGLEKRALVLARGQTPATWRSRFASVTFNQYGRELPNGGMNEAGVAVEVLILSETAYEPPDARPAVTELGLVQYLLDQAGSTAEAVELARGVRVAPASAALHYFVCDAGGACATLELLGRGLTVSAGADLPVRALTNSPYAASVAALGRRPEGNGSLARFGRLARALRGGAAADPVAGSLATLDTVRFPTSTQWQLVYELGARRVHFRSLRHPALKTVSLGAFAPGCAEPVMMLDMASDTAGDVSRDFRPYRGEANRALVEGTLRPRRDTLPPGTIAQVAAYGGAARCSGEAPGP